MTTCINITREGIQSAPYCNDMHEFNVCECNMMYRSTYMIGYIFSDKKRLDIFGLFYKKRYILAVAMISCDFKKI